MSASFQDLVQRKGEQIFQGMEDNSGSIFNKDWWYGKIMDWSMRNEQFKVQMFRFVDVLPYLNSGQEIARHLKEYFSEGGQELPSIFNFGVGVGALAPGLMAGAIRKNVTQMAKMFIVGENPQEAIEVLQKNRARDIGFTVDILGEATLSEKEALEYQSRYIELINWLAKDSDNWKSRPLIDSNHLGDIPKVNVSVKLSALYSQISSTAWDKSKRILKERLKPILMLAKERGVFINLDMESYSLKDLTFEVFEELMLEDRDYPHYGVVLQAYLRDSYQDLEKLLLLAQKRGTPFTIRLVKGAYWDYETIYAGQQNWPIPVYTNKAESDANYEKCATRLLENYKIIHLALGSHNVRSLAATLVVAEQKGVPKNAFEVQMLYGMADPIKRSLVNMGYRVREYSPVGELIPGMAYLVRRLLENTSNESFLRSKFAENVSTQQLLKDPATGLLISQATAVQQGFYNEPLIDFTQKKPRELFAKAVKDWEKASPVNVPIVIGKKEIKTDRTLESRAPAHPSKVLAKIALASKVEADQAVQQAKQAFQDWKNTSAETRAQYLDKLADYFAEHRMELAALQVWEVAKQWKEADGDVCEAIDFCRYYAKEMRRLDQPQRAGHTPGEASFYHYQPRGVVTVIAPWNFPLAILTGMVAAALVTGNTVVMKPAEQSSLVAWDLMKGLQKIGLPPGVVNFLPGYGEEVGEYLVHHKDVAMIAFTGSKQVGLHILRSASELQAGQHFVKKCVIEMGGKNAMIIDSDADLDEAVQAVIYSAFGFQGQKCSACSRVVVLDEIYNRFVERLVETAKSLTVALPEDPSCQVGPVIDETSQKRLLEILQNQPHKKLFQATTPNEGYFVPPTIYGDVDPSSPLAQEELFGPVLAVIRAKDLDHALNIANGTIYALTGGFLSRSPAHIERAKKEFEVGNLYINRQITGAMVERHPFGGFKLSGAGSKTGGPDYLLQYLEPRCVTENTMRRGFAPVDTPESVQNTNTHST